VSRIILLISISLISYLNSNAQGNSDELSKTLCRKNSVNFEQQIKNPFHSYLSKVYSVGNSDIELYINYLKYLFNEDDTHQLLNQDEPGYQELKNSLELIGICKNGIINYDPLIKVIKKAKPKDPVGIDLLDVLIKLEKNKYEVSGGIVAMGLTIALSDHGAPPDEYSTLVALILAPFAITRNGL